MTTDHDKIWVKIRYMQFSFFMTVTFEVVGEKQLQRNKSSHGGDRANSQVNMMEEKNISNCIQKAHAMRNIIKKNDYSKKRNKSVYISQMRGQHIIQKDKNVMK